MATPVTMPQLGETVVEGTIVKWLKSEGDSVERDEPLFEISTDKVDTEVPSPVEGVIQKILVEEGSTVEVGTELAIIDGAGTGGGPAEKTAEPEAGQARLDDAAEQKPDEPKAASEPAASSLDGPRSHILSPLVRKLADEHRVDLSQVQGTGTGGRVTKKDILAFVGSGAPAAASAQPAPALRAVPEEAPVPPPVAATAPAAGEREQVVQLSHIRKRIAENMAAVLHNSARAWNSVEVEMESIVRVRTRAKDRFKAQEGFSLTYMPFLGRAVCEALLAFPDVNARLDLEAGTAIYHRYVNLGIAVAYEDGLIVPVIKDADTMNVVGLARAVNDIAARARSKKLMPDEVHGGTFTITNPGPFGSLISIPIMNPGETAILAFDAIEKRPVVRDDAIAIRHMVYLSMSWDHRMIDGATASQFLGRIKENLETWDFTPEVKTFLG